MIPVVWLACMVCAMQTYSHEQTDHKPVICKPPMYSRSPQHAPSFMIPTLGAAFDFGFRARQYQLGYTPFTRTLCKCSAHSIGTFIGISLLYKPTRAYLTSFIS